MHQNAISFTDQENSYNISFQNGPEEGTGRLESEGNDMIALDTDGNGNIDTVLYGKVSKSQADLIYQTGLLLIQNPKTENIFIHSGSYESRDKQNEYLLQTFIMNEGRLSNRFTINCAAGETHISALDLDADGNIDYVEEGNNNLNEVNRRYREVLDRGIQQQALEHKYNLVFVKEP